jgi:cytoskeletal protein CcmA (bactofilin family)
MREERGTIAGPLVVFEPLELWGTIGGTVTVVEGGKFYMRGSIYGNLNVEYGGRVHIFGNIAGNLKVARGAKVIHSGTIVGDAVNEGGRLFVESTAIIGGKVKTLKGETKIEPKLIVRGATRRDAGRNGE